MESRKLGPFALPLLLLILSVLINYIYRNTAADLPMAPSLPE
jgi:hypothetical protein